MRHFPGLTIGALLGTLTVACSNPASPTSPTAQAEPAGMPSPAASIEPSPMDPAGISAARSFEAATAKTRIIGVTGNLAGRIGPTITFGNIPLGTAKSALVQIANTGTAALTVTAVSAPAGYSVTFPSGPPLVIQPNRTQSVTIGFSPKAPNTYSENNVVTSDATSGTKTVAVSGTGAPRVSFGAATWIVGRDIQPGRYYTSVLYSGANSSTCVLARFNVYGQQIGGIGTLAGALQQVVDTSASDYSVNTPPACGTWSMTPSYAGAIYLAVDLEPAEAAGLLGVASVNAGLGFTVLMADLATSLFAPRLVAAGAYLLLAAFVATTRRNLDEFGPALFIAVAGVTLSFLVGVGWRSDYPAFVGMSLVTLVAAVLTAFASAYLRLTILARNPDKASIAMAGAALVFCHGCLMCFSAVIPSALKAGRLNRSDG